MRKITAKDMCEKVRRFQNSYVLFSRSGEIQNIVVKSFWTPEGRLKILRDIRRRLRILTDGYDCSYQLTLTYRDFSDYRKSDISRFLNSFLRMFRYRGIRFSYFWVAEIQKRGMIHYHILFFLHSRDRRKVFDLFRKERIDRLWGKGYTFITFSRRTMKKAYSYAVKYLLKTVRREDDFYLELVLFFREYAGRFRLYGMSQIRRFPRGMRKNLNIQTIRAISQSRPKVPLFLLERWVAEKGLDWVLRNVENVQGWAVLRTARVVPRVYWLPSVLPPPDVQSLDIEIEMCYADIEVEKISDEYRRMMEFFEEIEF